MTETLAIVLAQLEGNRLVIAGIVSIVLGVLILVMPRLLNYIVAAYLIIIGVLWLLAGL
jgi:uncharacterized membrane protein HdeD (DUF308 family)